jgi:predicted ATPase
MSRIKIKNFGPIKEGLLENDGWVDIKKVTVFIGNQGSGKSTVAKVISTLMWMEKAINRGDIAAPESINDFQTYFKYQSLKDYFKSNTVIEYYGAAFSIIFNKDNSPFPIFKKVETGNYTVPKIMYVPDGRSFLSVIKNATGVRGLPAPLFEFAEELKRGQADTSGEEIPLPVNGVNYKYESESDTSFIIGEGFKENLLIASSGFQSLVPLFLVARSLAHVIVNGAELNSSNISVDQSIKMSNEISKIMLTNNFTNDEKIKKVDEVRGRFQNKCFINIVEEPEQNLFPSSQQQLLNSLLTFNNMNAGNKLIMTTHSPYLINYLSIAVQGGYLLTELNKKSDPFDLIERLDAIVPKASLILGDELVVYQLDEKNGTITKLGSTEGIPSDKNYLNQSIRHGNEMFDALLEIEEEL